MSDLIQKLEGVLIILIDSKPYDVAEHYRHKGFDALPATPTMSGYEICAASGKGMEYRVHRLSDDGAHLRDEVGGTQAVALKNGMHFCVIPPATWGVTR